MNFKMISLVSLFASAVAAPAFGQAFFCTANDAQGNLVQVNAAVIDVGDEEGEVVLSTSDSKITQYHSYFGGYLDESKKTFQYFVFNEDNAASANQPQSLHLNEAGTEGVLKWEKFESPAQCTTTETLGRYALLASKFGLSYSAQGSDNNEVGFKTSKAAAKNLDSQAQEISAAQVRTAISECVFPQAGAYGEHISAKVQAGLSVSLLSELNQLAKAEKNQLKFFRSSKLLGSDNTLAEPTCSVLVQVDGTQTLALNGTLKD